MSMFVKAEKKAAKLRLSLSGPSGSGKTYTALLFAQAFAPNGKIAVVDTEHGSASKYADSFSFDVVELSNFHPTNYVKAIKAAVDAGYEVVVLDSITHAWNGPGGILSIVNQNFGKWKDVQPIEQGFIEAMISSPIHIIATMRAKTQYEVEKDPTSGKPTPKKIGMGAIQREGIEYEFDIAAMMDVRNTIMIEKTRCPAMQDASANRPDASFVKPVIEWLSGAPAHRPPPTVSTNGDHTKTPGDKSPAFKRFMAEGTKTFNGEWDNARHWLIERYTKKKTPDKVRASANDLYDDECTVLADALIAQRKFYQDEWESHKQPAPEAA
jgi:hypothetical protein